MKPYVDGLRHRGLEAFTVPRQGRLPMKAERALDVFRAQVGQLGGAVIGGHSYGGRVATMLAAEETPAGLLLFSYPLHRPGHPEELRTQHWPAITCPVLVLSGESDSFAQIALLKASISLLPQGRLLTYPGVGHGIARHSAALEDALDQAAAFVRALG